MTNTQEQDSREEQHWADPAYIVETADGEYKGHTGRKHLARGMVRDLDEETDDGPHSWRETSFHEVNEVLDG